MKTLIVSFLCLFLMACSNQSATEKKNSQDATQTDTEASSSATVSSPAPAGGTTLNELFTNKEQYNGKTVRIRGKVMKVNRMIMNRNWVHISDGTLQDNSMDLTVTTQEELTVDQEVTVEGVIALDKDFGSGYKYVILMEDAKVISN